jgi:hypothetical protein
MTKVKLHVLYVAGLGDDKVTGQRLAVRAWRLWGVRAEVFQPHWDNDEPWDAKRGHLLTKLDQLISENKPVALIGVSAGASAAINIYALRKSQLVGCVLIAGKINHANAIGEIYRQRNLAFVESAEACEKSLLELDASDRERMMSRYAIFDNLIPREDSKIAGAHNRMVLSIGHAITIATQIVIGAPLFLHFLKALVKKTSVA